MTDKQRKLGFSLVELLAVIVVLAIIALIAIPVIGSVISNANKSSFEKGMYNIKDAAQFYVESSLLTDDMKEDSCRYFSFDNDVDSVTTDPNTGRTYVPVSYLQLKGDLPTSGEVKACTDKITINVSNGTYSGSYDSDGESNVVEGGLEDADTSTPVIRNIHVIKKGLDYIQVAVDAYMPNDFGKIVSYSFSLDGEEWVSGSSNTYTYEALRPDTEYTLYVKVESKSGIVTEDKLVVRTVTFNEITISPQPSGWSTSKTISISGETAGYELYYQISSYDATMNDYVATEFMKYTEPFVLDIASNSINQTRIYAKFYNGAHESDWKSTTITKIDTTAPANVDFSYATTTNTIKVTAIGVDNESGIYGYQFSQDGGVTWSDVNSFKEYTFANLQSGTYNIAVRVINKTYPNSTMSDKNSTVVTKVISPDTIGECRIEVEPSGWAVNKKVTIIGSANGAELQYKIGNEDWSTIGSGYEVVLGDNANVYCRITDGINTGDTEQVSIVSIDKTAPEILNVSHKSTTNSIEVIATGTDKESGIYGYQFSKDGGVIWSDIQTAGTYKFDGLTTGSYNIAVRVVNNTYVNDGIVEGNSKVMSETLSTLQIPKCGISVSPSGWSTSKVATISGSVLGAELQYKIGNGNWITIDDGGSVQLNQVATQASPINLYCRFYDKTNNDSGKMLQVRTIDPSAPSDLTYTYATTTSAIKIIANGIDNESGIYGYQFSKDGGATWTGIQTSNEYTFGSLTTGTYSMAIRAINGTYSNNGITENNIITKKINLDTEKIDECNIVIEPSGWSTSKVATISGSATGAGLQYRIDQYKEASGSVVQGSWIDAASGATVTLTDKATSTYPTSVYCRITDNINTVNGKTKTITAGIDTTKPSSSLALKMYTGEAQLTATCTDSESGITKYEFSKDGGSTWNANGTTKTYTYAGLTQGTEHSFKVRCTNGAGITNTSNAAGTTASIISPTWGVSPSGYVSTSKTATVTYNGSGIASPVYFLKSTISGKTNVALATCTTASTAIPKNSSECTGTSIAANGTISANKWYMVKSGTSAAITVTTNGSLVAVTSDGTNTKTSSSQTISGIDPTAPGASLTGTIYTNKAVLTATCTDNESGITKYEFSKDGGSTWTNNGTTKTYTYTGLTQGTAHSFKVRCTNGSSLTATGTLSETTKTIATPTWGVSPSGYVSTSKTATVTYSSTGIASPVYFLKSTISGKTNVALATCTTASTAIPKNSSECTGTSIAANGTISANKWYMVKSGISAAITVTTNGSLVAVTSDGTNTKTSSSQTISEIESGTLTVTVSGKNPSGTAVASAKWVNTNVTLTASASGSNSGYNYQWYTGTSASTANGTAISGATSSTYTASTGGYYYVVATSNSGLKGTSSIYTYNKDTTAPTCSFSGENTTWTKSPQTVTATCKDSQSGCTAATATKSWTYSSGQYLYVTPSYTISDNAGNSTTCTQNVNIYFDTVGPDKPTVSLTLNNATGSTYASGTWTKENIYHTVKSYASYVGIDYYQYSHDGVEWSNDITTLTGWGASYESELRQKLYYTISWNGAWNFYIRAVDKLGNVSAASDMFTVRSDKTVPTLTVDSVTTGSTTMTIKYTASDSHSGVSNTVCYYGAITSSGSGSSSNSGIVLNNSVTGSNGTCSITGLTPGINYYYNVLTTDNVGYTASVTGNATTAAACTKPTNFVIKKVVTSASQSSDCTTTSKVVYSGTVGSYGAINQLHTTSYKIYVQYYADNATYYQAAASNNLSSCSSSSACGTGATPQSTCIGYGGWPSGTAIKQVTYVGHKNWTLAGRACNACGCTDWVYYTV